MPYLAVHLPPIETYAASVDWGDGTTTDATATVSGGTITLPDHTYAHIGTYFATLTVSDSGGASTDVPFNITAGSPKIVLSVIGFKGTYPEVPLFA
jgi:hypothetical protein